MWMRLLPFAIALFLGAFTFFAVMGSVSDSGAPSATSSPVFFALHTPESVIAVKESIEKVADSVVHSEPIEAVVAIVTRSAWKKGTATVFWVGEDAGPENDYIHNAASAWDGRWEEHFGGIDDPECRNGYYPCGFTPRENPFYIALPFNDLDDNGRRKASATHIPWNNEQERRSVLKNRWIVVRHGSAVCYAQWQDVGPNHQDDWDYVFEDALRPLNTFGVRAGIDLSPAMRDCLKVGDVSEIEWQHVEAADVPQGPWSEIVTTRR